jgi:hypothetical protein
VALLQGADSAVRQQVDGLLQEDLCFAMFLCALQAIAATVALLQAADSAVRQQADGLLREE